MFFTYRRFAERRRAELHARGHRVATRAGTVEYAETGPAGGPPVLYFHGGPGGHEQLHVLDPLARRGYRIIGWSRPGYLRTPLTTGRTFAEQADAAAALLDELGVRSAAAYAISGGGPSAIEFARRHPARTDSLVLESAISGRYDPVISPTAGRIYLSPYGTWLITRLAERWPRAAVADLVRQESSLDARTRRGVVEWIMADHRRSALAHDLLAGLTPYEDRAAGLDNDLLRWAELDDTLTAGVTCPTLVLHGSHDGDVDPAHARHAAATIPGADLHVVPGGWHILPLSPGGGSAREALRDFLAARNGGPS
ncbi:alpha/beta fold hydrolase [Nocardiopsis lucentensis]|uniref:alpha/beta fold hydrolase n=1 Tax=Nocardiopsis lucentensis TaxID=53441 RepID=UPI000348BF9F|nr:alpha/beta hydrolase [Nocardiopsis lucentensis]